MTNDAKASEDSVLGFFKDYFTKKGFELNKDLRETSIRDDLAIDSVDLMELFSEIEGRYGRLIDVDDYQERNLDNVGNLAKYLSKD